MKRLIITPLGLLATVILGVCGAGAAQADPMADKSRMVTTENGWDLRVTTRGANLDRVPNLANTAFSREGFVNLTADADITGKGDHPVDSGSLTLGFELGCQVDVSTGVVLGMAAWAGPSVGVTVTPTPGLNVGASAAVEPSISVNPKPGTITTLPFGTKPLAGPHGSVSAQQVQIKVDGCAGPVSIRSYAVASMSTSTADNSVAVYGDPIWL